MSTNYQPECNEPLAISDQSFDQADLASSTTNSNENGQEELSADLHKAIPRADELTEKELEDFAKKYQLVCLVKSGKSSREALEHLDIKGSESWVRKLCKRFEKEGPVGLLDGRSKNGSDRRLLTKKVEEMTLALWYSRGRFQGDLGRAKTSLRGAE
jgi:hypothetical protein